LEFRKLKYFLQINEKISIFAIDTTGQGIFLRNSQEFRMDLNKE